MLATAVPVAAVDGDEAPANNAVAAPRAIAASPAKPADLAEVNDDVLVGIHADTHPHAIGDENAAAFSAPVHTPATQQEEAAVHSPAEAQHH